MIKIQAPEGRTPQPKKEIKRFGAKTRILFDFLLFLNAGFFLFYLVGVFRSNYFLKVIASVDVAAAVFWYGVAGTIAKIEIAGGAICGRDGFLKKNSFPLRKVHLARTMVPIPGLLKFFYKDICSIDGQSIRLWRRVIGQDQVRKIMVIIQEYPFRETPYEDRKSDPPAESPPEEKEE